MKKVIVMMLALVCSTMVMAQDSYRELLKEYTSIYTPGSIDMKESLNSFQKMAEEAGYSTADAQAAAKTFYEEKMKPKVEEIMCKSFKKNISEDELKQLITAFKSEAGQTAMKHAASLTSSEKTKKIQELMAPGLMEALQGGTPQSIAAPDCPESYKTKFAKYDELCGASDMLGNMLDQVKPFLKDVPGGEAILTKLQNYMNANKTNIVMNLSYPELTEQDLDFQISVYGSTAGQHLKPTLKSITGDLVSYALSAAQEFKDSLKK